MNAEERFGEYASKITIEWVDAVTESKTKIFEAWWRYPSHKALIKLIQSAVTTPPEIPGINAPFKVGVDCENIQFMLDILIAVTKELPSMSASALPLNPKHDFGYNITIE